MRDQNMIGVVKDLALESRRGPESEIEVWDLVHPDRASLNRLKRISLRNRSWFNVLSWEQRRFMDAVMMTLDKIRSLLLLRVLAPLVRKLITATGGDAGNGALALMDQRAYRMMESVAEKIAGIAQRWGNRSAHEWTRDAGFIKYLMAMSLPRNKNPPMFTLPSWQGKV